MINKNYVDKMPLWGWGGGAWRRLVAGFGLLGMVQVGAAQGFFQGTCVYRVTAQSKVQDLNDKDIHIGFDGWGRTYGDDEGWQL